MTNFAYEVASFVNKLEIFNTDYDLRKKTI